MVERIYIEKFKGIDHLNITPCGNFNVLIGENNIGKTTIFEAIHLWKMCYDLNLKKDKSGFYANARNMKFEGMESIRVYHDQDLFPIGTKDKDAKCKIILTIRYGEESYELGFTIGKVSNISDAYLQMEYVDSNEFKRFANMVASVQGKNLSTFIAINESKPIPNIIAKEPYMYKAQVLDKISKGKGNEVLRNKVISHMAEVESHINAVMGAEYSFSEHEKEDKTYISIKVNGKDIFSYGSGFLQLTEIFSSMEYLEPEIYILLIDEPDAHLHLKLQKKLIEEFREIPNSQLFIITHNERFLEEVNENELLFLSEDVKMQGNLTRLPNGAKKIAFENLKGCLEQLDILEFASKIVTLEGPGDLEFLNNIKPLYEQYLGVSEPANAYLVMVGIDTLNAKLIAYSRALKGIIQDECSWLIIRDTDCVPINKKVAAGNDDKRNMDTAADVKVWFQEGYGIESTFVAEKEKLARMLRDYYSLNDSYDTIILQILTETNAEFERAVKDITNEDVHQQLKKHFERQLANRSGRTYRDLTFVQMLSQITEDNIQYIMTKEILNKYLKAVHNKIKTYNQSITAPALDRTTIFTFYYSWVSSADDLYDCHKTLLGEIYR